MMHPYTAFKLYARYTSGMTRFHHQKPALRPPLQVWRFTHGGLNSASPPSLKRRADSSLCVLRRRFVRTS